MAKCYHYRGPTIDHTILSPSGRCSKRTRKAAMDREAARLFPPGFWDTPEPTEEEKRAAKVLSLRRHAATLRGLAERGMCRRKFTKEADAAEAEADALESQC